MNSYGYDHRLDIDWSRAPGGEDQPIVFPMGLGYRVMGNWPSGKRPCVHVFGLADGLWHLEKAQWTRTAVTSTSLDWRTIRDQDGGSCWSTAEEAVLVAMEWLVAWEAERRLGGDS